MLIDVQIENMVNFKCEVSLSFYKIDVVLK